MISEKRAFEEESFKKRLDILYELYNDKKYIQYDPIRYVHEFENDVEREVVGLISSSLSFGRVKQILKAIDYLLTIMGRKPLHYTMDIKRVPDSRLLSFKYRFVSGADIHRFLSITRELIERYGSVGSFVNEIYKGDLLGLVDAFTRLYHGVGYMIPSSVRGSACKRLFMYFRWMVRKDNIDLGLWNFISPEDLIIPLDTHVFRTAKSLGLTSKKTPSLKAAMEITENLRKLCKDDPVKYDWPLSHIWIIKNNYDV